MKKYGDTPHLLTFGLTTYSSDTRYVKNIKKYICNFGHLFFDLTKDFGQHKSFSIL